MNNTIYFRLGSWFYGAMGRWFFWFRLFGKGPSVERDGLRTFSERYGYQKVIRIGGWKIKWLK